MNVQSKDAEDIDPVKEGKKKYLMITYGGVGSGGRAGAPTNLPIGLGGGLFDIFFEKLGLKKKSHKRSEGED